MNSRAPTALYLVILVAALVVFGLLGFLLAHVMGVITDAFASLTLGLEL